MFGDAGLINRALPRGGCTYSTKDLEPKAPLAGEMVAAARKVAERFLGAIARSFNFISTSDGKDDEPETHEYERIQELQRSRWARWAWWFFMFAIHTPTPKSQRSERRLASMEESRRRSERLAAIWQIWCFCRGFP